METKKRVAIYVSGGNVQEILTNDKDIEIEVVDADNQMSMYISTLHELLGKYEI